MEKEFIPYQQALALKNLGYDWPCLSWYNLEQNRVMGSGEYDNEGQYYKHVGLPLYQQVFRWFRERHKLFMLMQVGQHNGEHQTFYFNVFKFGKNLYKSKFRSKTGVYTYEEAELACLKKLIEIVKEKS